MINLFSKTIEFYFKKLHLSFLWYNLILGIFSFIFFSFFFDFKEYNQNQSNVFFEIFKWLNGTFFYADFHFLFIQSKHFNSLFEELNFPNIFEMIPILNFCFLLLFLVALVLYTLSNRNSSRLLAFCASIITISLGVKLIHEVFLIIYFTTIIDYFFAIKFCLGNLFLFFFYFKLVKFLLDRYRCKQNIQVTKDVQMTEKKDELRNVKLSAKEQLELHSSRNFVKIRRNDVIKSGILNRFAHLMLDTFLFIVCFSLVIQFIGNNYVPKFESDFINFIHEFSKRDDSLYFLLFSWKFLYYLFFETFFKTTPAKILTHSMVVSSEKEEALSFIRILGRTSARFIPFNSLSFLFKSIWHDSLSTTMVVRVEKQNEQQENK